MSKGWFCAGAGRDLRERTCAKGKGVYPKTQKKKKSNGKKELRERWHSPLRLRLKNGSKKNSNRSSAKREPSKLRYKDF